MVRLGCYYVLQKTATGVYHRAGSPTGYAAVADQGVDAVGSGIKGGCPEEQTLERTENLLLRVSDSSFRHPAGNPVSDGTKA